PRRTLLGTSIRAIAVLLVLLLLGLVAWRNINWDRFLTQRKKPAIAEAVAEKTSPAEPNKAVVSPNAAVLEAQKSVVLLQADGPGGLVGVGAGIVIDPNGLVATSYHLSSDLTAGVARFQDGRVFAIAGYAAVDPDNDLAILQLEKASGLPTAKLKSDEGLRPLTTVFAIGHPRGVEFALHDGKVSRRIRTSQLSAMSQRFIRALAGSGPDHVWIQHTAVLSEGNSGGPLVNEQGEVLGINTWVDRQGGFGYALDVTSLLDLQKKQFPQVAPLEAYATQEARRKSLLLASSAKKLQTLFDEAQSMGWRPKNGSDYALLQKIAWMVTIANQPNVAAAGDELNERLAELAKQADVVTAQLRREKWNDIGQITLLNEYAAAAIPRPATGVVFFGTVERLVEGSGQRALLVRLAGFEQRVLIPLGSKLHVPPSSSQCFILGINDQGKTVSYGDNPLQPTVAPVITAAVIVEME
ncbi:MAG: serine protease, partial [Planctomycetales bacterium]|nr:serine protease [Planctomycetales bacterium]